MLERAVEFVVGRIATLRRHGAMRSAARDARRHFPELLAAYRAFGAAHQISSNRQPLKGSDLWQILERVRPRHITEMGSGTTSAVFALWARRNGARYIAFEHHPQWAQVTQRCLAEVGLTDPNELAVRIVPSRIREDGQATGFVEPIPPQSDFVYIDGPPCRLEDGRKVPNDDIVRLFDIGARPRTIVVDGRWETVDLIRSHPIGRQYHCEPQYAYSHRRGLWREAMKGREHTLFTLPGN
jgi:hypothetical protein